MVKSTKIAGRVSTPKSSKIPLPKSKTSSGKVHLDQKISDDWTVFSEKLVMLVGMAKIREDELEELRAKVKTERALAVKNGTAGKMPRMPKDAVQAPYDKPESILKREVYKFVRDHLTEQNSSRFEDVLDENITNERRLRVEFSANPFHKIFLALRSEGIEIKPFEITRYSSQLLYARRHEIVPDMLIGFLYQTGSPDVIRERVMNTKYWEPWYLARLNSAS